MYTREILTPTVSPVQDGKPIIGTWDSAFDKVDLLEIRKPYKYPVPRWVIDSRIKEWQCFSVQDDDFFLEAIFSNLKLFRIAHIMFYDKKNNEKYVFRKIRPGTGWQLPNSLANSSMDSRSSGFYFRIHSWLDADTVTLDINIEAFRRRPSLTVHLAYNLNSHDVTPMAVSLGVTGQRNIYAYKAIAPVRGDMVFDGRHISLKQETASGFFCDFKGFFPYRTQINTCKAMGFIEGNRRIGFHIAENQTRETYKNNENALWIDGKLTPLPPVLITMPNGQDAGWVIQDVEGMVDLAFTPKEHYKKSIKFFITNVDHHVPLGLFSGMLVNSEGKKIQIKNLFGIGEKINLRV